jgi:hypothetical protein
MPISTLDAVDQSIADFKAAVLLKMDRWLRCDSPEAFLAVEREAHHLARALADRVSAAVLRHRVADPDLSSRCVNTAVGTGRYRRNGSRSVRVTFLGGNTHEFDTAYLPAARNGRHRRRQPGLLPVMAALGVWWNTSPALADEISRQVTDSNSLRDALQTLRRRGIALEYKRTLTLVQRFSRRAVQQRAAWVNKILNSPMPEPSESLRDKTVMVAIDGGRLRERHAKRGRRRKSGYHAYHTPWREPRQFVITVLDDRGRPHQHFAPIYDATLGDADQLFLILFAYLRALGVSSAKHLVVVADGAEWIWRRVPCLAIGLAVQSRLVQVIDYSHAVSTLHEIVAECVGWSAARRQRWAQRAESALYRGNIDKVADLIRQIAVGRRAKRILSHLPYFTNNRARMNYPRLRKQQFPQGSGAVESAIRRVINLRLKSAGKFWLRDNAEGMLHLRSYLKAGHWEQLTRRTLTGAIPWNNDHADFLPDIRRAA